MFIKFTNFKEVTLKFFVFFQSKIPEGFDYCNREMPSQFAVVRLKYRKII
jgi:hypothetical protein